MHILFVTRGCCPESAPLLGVFELDQAKALTSLGCKISYIALDFRSIRRKRKLGYRLYKKDNIDVYELSLPIGAVPLKLFIWIGRICMMFLFRKVLRNNGLPDIVHSHFATFGAIAAILKQKYNIPFVHTEHSSEISESLSDRKKKIYGKAYKMADSVISVSKCLCDSLKNIFNIKSTEIYNIIDLNIYKYDKNNSFSDISKPFTFVSVGGLIYRKGFDLLINAFSILINNNINAKLVIIGNGPMLGTLKEKANNLNISNKITFTGYLSRSKISKILADSQVFVLASRHETFGVVYAEAMAAGLPVIATMCGGPESFINKTSGILIPPENVSELAKAMNTVYFDIGRYDRKIISDYASRLFSYKSVGGKIVEVYNKVLTSER